MSIGEKIRKARELCHLKQAELAEKVNANTVTVSRWERNINVPNSAALSAIAAALNTTVAFLTGETDDPTPAPLQRTVNKSIQHLLENGGKLPDLPESNARPVKTIKVPFFSGIVKACCGDGNGYPPDMSLEQEGSFDIPISELEAYMWQVGPRGFGTIRVEGSSMEPRIHDGDIILYGDLPYSNGNFVLVRYDDRLIVRGIWDDHNGHYTLKALNPAYKDIRVDIEDESKSFFTYGKVIRRISMENLADGMM